MNNTDYIPLQLKCLQSQTKKASVSNIICYRIGSKLSKVCKRKTCPTDSYTKLKFLKETYEIVGWSKFLLSFCFDYSLEKDIATCCHYIINSFEDSYWKLKVLIKNLTLYILNDKSCIGHHTIVLHIFD